MKTLKKAASLILLLCLIVSFGMGHSSAAEGNVADNSAETLTLSTEQILEAAAPLIEAEEEYYNILSVSAEGATSTLLEDGTVETVCSIVFQMCLKADSVEELPYVAGMLKAMNVETAEECYAMQTTGDMGSFDGDLSPITLVPEDSAVAALVSERVHSYSEYIGATSELAFPIMITSSRDGTVNTVFGYSCFSSAAAGNTFPLEDYFPGEAEEMFASGVETVTAIRSEISDTDISEPNARIIDYYRILARDYAKTYSSNTTPADICPCGNHTHMNVSKYNPSYKYYCGNDCANFVSQALYAGGVPTDSTWQPESHDWVNVNGLYSYFHDTKSYWVTSNFTDCAAGGVIFYPGSNGGFSHVALCVLNDSVNHAMAAHTYDYSSLAYTAIDVANKGLQFYWFPKYIDTYI